MTQKRSSLKKRKICVVVASRANYGRVKTLMTAIKNHPQLELQLVVSASALLYRFGNAVEVIRQDGFVPDATVYIVIEGENPVTMAKSTGLAIVELATIFENLKPDIVLTVADRYETLATAVAASYMNIPLAHTQGGEITGSIDESVRHAITKLAHLHFPSTAQSARRLIKMGESAASVFDVGCPAIDLASGVDCSLPIAQVMKRYGGTGADLDWNKPYLLVMQHPVTTEYPKGFAQIQETIKAIHHLKMQTVWLWPNVDAGSDDVAKGIRVYREKERPDFVHFYRNFSADDYVRVLNGCACIVGNSSSGIRESAFLGVPCVNVGTRQEGRERGANVKDVGYDAAEILKAIQFQIKKKRYPSSRIYGDGRAGQKIAEILAQVEVQIQKKLAY